MTIAQQLRQTTMEKLQNEVFDLVIIGGGITGCGIALDASARGLSVALLEMQDFAAGTSSRSTKLVHGGLRYLKQFEVKEVAELGKERAIVYENGPHVTTPVWMLLPFHKGGTFGKFSTNIGLRVYDFLAGVKRSERRFMLNAEATLDKEPLVKREGLQGGGVYVEYRTDDARLTIEVAKAAVEQGATLMNYAKVQGFTYNNKKINGVIAHNEVTGEEFSVRATTVINAAGPWVDDVRKSDEATPGKKHLILSKGVHLVFDEDVFPLHQAVYFDTPDGRMVFAIPRNGKTYVGTTDTFYEGDAKEMDITQADRDYLMQAIHYMFPAIKVTDAHVESSWAGVRPLIHEDGKNPSEISRKDEVWTSTSGLVTIAGGKLTGYRKMAETVLDEVLTNLAPKLGKNITPCRTKKLPISGGDIGGSKNLATYIERRIEKGIALGLTKKEATRIAKQYGSNAEVVLQYVNSNDTALPNGLYAELCYGIEHEMVIHPNDFLIRRTGDMFFAITQVKKYQETVLAEMARQLGWTEAQQTRYAKEVVAEITRATTAK